MVGVLFLRGSRGLGLCRCVDVVVCALMLGARRVFDGVAAPYLPCSPTQASRRSSRERSDRVGCCVVVGGGGRCFVFFFRVRAHSSLVRGTGVLALLLVCVGIVGGGKGWKGGGGLGRHRWRCCWCGEWGVLCGAGAGAGALGASYVCILAGCCVVAVVMGRLTDGWKGLLIPALEQPIRTCSSQQPAPAGPEHHDDGPMPPSPSPSLPRGRGGVELRLLRSLWGVVVQEPQALDPLLTTVTTAIRSGSRDGPAGVPVRSKIIPSTLDHKLFPSRQARAFLLRPVCRV